MESTIGALLAPGKGILATDESLPTISKRFAALNIPCTEANRLAYREMLFSTSGIGDFISGVILFDETLHQRMSDGTPMPEALARRGIITGIKVDTGTVPLANAPHEVITQGLDGLRERLIIYRGCGARFTKWRAVLSIGETLPSHACVAAQANALALFAALSQEAGLVPLVEPEVLMDGSHTIERSEAVATAVLRRVFASLAEQGVMLEHLLLKVGMILPGSRHPEQAGVAQVAEATLRCLRCAVPAAVPGIVFLSGGQGDKIATQRLNAICHPGNAPWRLGFSFGRALQAPALALWNESGAHDPEAQAALLHRVQCNSNAIKGVYSPELEKFQIGTSQHARNPDHDR